MKTAIVIPTFNAVKNGVWREVLDALALHNGEVCWKIIVDCASGDETCSMASSYGWQCFYHKKERFDHGRTRNRICRILHRKGVENVIFLSQDVVLNTPDAVQHLLDFLHENDVAGCYGRQLTSEENSLNAWQRRKSYPEESYVKNAQDLKIEGAGAAFFSNAFSAWKTADVIRYGGFPETVFGEDALLAYQVLLQGGKIGYCAEAVVIHDHSCAWHALFYRGLQVGRFHRKHPVFSGFKFRKSSFCFPLSLPLFLPFAIKTSGYLAGRLGL